MKLKKLLITVCSALLFSSIVPISPSNAVADGYIPCSISGNFRIVSNVVTQHSSCTGSAIIPHGVTSIAAGAFYFAESLTSVSIPSSVTSIGAQAFRSARALISVSIPSGVTSIGNAAFAYATSLTSVTIPSSVTSIGSQAFFVTGLTSVSIPSSVTSIGAQAFYVTGLTSVSIPSSVTTLGGGAFGAISTLQSAKFAGNAPLSIARAFSRNDPNFKVYYPCGATGYDSLSSKQAYCQVIYDTKGGSSVPNDTFDEGSSISSAPTNPTRAGYTFQGWSATDGGSVIDFPYSPGASTDITLYAVWSGGSHAVTFNSNNGSAVSDGTFLEGQSFEAPTAPTRTGYTFLGWSATDGGSVVEFPYSPSTTSDITLYARWSADSHAVTFNSKGGTTVSAGSFDTDGSLTAPTAPTRTGYTFLGWSATDGGSVVVFPYSPGVIVDVTLYAKWSINTYVVSFNPKGGTSVTSGSFVYDGSIASAPRVPYRSGATFAGWSATDGGSAVSFPYSPGVASNVTLYAKWIVLAPVLSTSTPTTLVPGDVVTLRVSRVNEGCTVSVGWTDANTGVSSVSKIIKADRTTGVFTIATPAIAGSYTLATNRISAECSGGLAVTLAKAFVIGKSSSVMAKVVTSNVYVAKNPVVSVSGTVKSGSVAVSNKAVTVSLRRNGVEVATASGTTNGSGVFNISLSSGSYVSGDYTAVVTVVADSVYRQAQVTTTKLTLR